MLEQHFYTTRRSSFGEMAMELIKTFSEAVTTRINRDRQEFGQRQNEVSGQMEVLLEKRRQLEAMNSKVITDVIHPMMNELAGHFANARPCLIETSLARSAVTCEFSHTTRFPAKVTLSLALAANEELDKVVLRYSLSILPMLIEFEQYHEREFPPHETEEIGQWVAEKLLHFLDTYLLLETHPLYQKDNVVVDPVCKMRFPIDEAAGYVEFQGRIEYFCSEVCKTAFLRDSGRSGHQNGD